MSTNALTWFLELLRGQGEFLTHPLTLAGEAALFTLLIQTHRLRKHRAVPEGTVVEKGQSYATCRHDGRLVEGRNRVFAAIDQAIAAIRVSPGSYSLLRIRLARPHEHPQQEIRSAMLSTLEEGAFFGRIDARTYILGIRNAEQGATSGVLHEVAGKLLAVLPPGDLDVGLAHTADGTRSALELYREVVDIDLDPLLEQLSTGRVPIKKRLRAGLSRVADRLDRRLHRRCG